MQQRDNLDPVSTNPIPSCNINVVNTLRYKSFKSILDDMFKF